MKTDAALSDTALLQLLGQRLMQLRLSRNLTQQQLADQAGLGLRTVQRLEQGEAAMQLSGFLRVCRVLGLIERFDLLLPETAPGPMQQLQSQRRPRQRASVPRVAARKAGSAPAKWTWGEDT